MTLAQLARGGRGVVISVDQSDSSTRTRFHARGFVPGAAVTVVQRGDPLVVSVDHSRWALSRAEAELIQILGL